MYRISVVMAGLAVAAVISSQPAFAQTCDQRIAGSCPVQAGIPPTEADLASAAAASAGTEATEPLGYARAGKEAQVKKRSRRGSRAAHRSARKKVEERRAAKPTDAVPMPRRAPRVREAAVASAGSAPAMQAEGSAAPNAAYAAAGASEALPGAVSPISSGFVAATADQPRAGGEMTGSARIDTASLGGRSAAAVPGMPVGQPAAAQATAASASGRLQTADASGVQGGKAQTTAAAQPSPPTPPQAATAPAAAEDTSWMRIMIMAFGGLVAAGSVIRMVV